MTKPPANPDAVRAVLSEGKVGVDPDALDYYGAEFFEKLNAPPEKS